jgi:hypothetical protein
MYRKLDSGEPGNNVPTKEEILESKDSPVYLHDVCISIQGQLQALQQSWSRLKSGTNARVTLGRIPNGVRSHNTV